MDKFELAYCNETQDTYIYMSVSYSLNILTVQTQFKIYAVSTCKYVQAGIQPIPFVRGHPLGLSSAWIFLLEKLSIGQIWNRNKRGSACRTFLELA